MDIWHVVLLSPGFEPSCFAALEKWGAVWPRWVERKVVKGRVRFMTRPLAPGYMFVRFNGSDPVLWHDVKDACRDGFRAFIGGELPIPVFDDVMEGFLGRCVDATGLMEPPVGPRSTLRQYRAGERVRLVGVLGAVEGIVTWADDRGIRVETTMFNRRTEMWLPRGSGAIEGEVASERPRRRRRSARRFFAEGVSAIA